MRENIIILSPATAGLFCAQFGDVGCHHVGASGADKPEFPWESFLLFLAAQSALVLLVTDLFHPVDNLPVELFLNGDVRHGRGRGSPMPVLLARREPDHITGSNLLDRSPFALNPAAASRDDESLTERMPVPCSPRARLEGHAGTLNECRIGCLKERVDP